MCWMPSIRRLDEIGCGPTQSAATPSTSRSSEGGDDSVAAAGLGRVHGGVDALDEPLDALAGSPLADTEGNRHRAGCHLGASRSSSGGGSALAKCQSRCGTACKSVSGSACLVANSAADRAAPSAVSDPSIPATPAGWLASVVIPGHYSASAGWFRTIRWLGVAPLVEAQLRLPVQSAGYDHLDRRLQPTLRGLAPVDDGGGHGQRVQPSRSDKVEDLRQIAAGISP